MVFLQANMLHDRLAQIFELTIRYVLIGAAIIVIQHSVHNNYILSSTPRPPPSPSGVVSISAGHTQHQSVPVYEMKFPDLCVY